MSGWLNPDPATGRGRYQPLDSKWRRYHDRHCADPDCPGDWLDHATRAGFVVAETLRGGYVVLNGPGLDEGSTDELWTAVTGKPGDGAAWHQG